MTTLSRTFESASARESEARWAAWEARGIARDAQFRKCVIPVLWVLGGIAVLAAVLL
jgi:hypothetical protein